MIADELIFDRDQSDISNRTKKAFHNIEDLQRIMSACEEIAKKLGVTTILDIPAWRKNDDSVNGKAISYTRSNWIALLWNLQLFRNIVADRLPESTPQVPPDFNRPTIERANDIEKILYDIFLVAEQAPENSHGNLNQFTHGTLSSFTHEKLSEGVVNNA